MNMRWIWKFFPRTTESMAQEIDNLKFKLLQREQTLDRLVYAIEEVLKLLKSWQEKGYAADDFSIRYILLQTLRDEGLNGGKQDGLR